MSFDLRCDHPPSCTCGASAIDLWVVMSCFSGHGCRHSLCWAPESHLWCWRTFQALASILVSCKADSCYWDSLFPRWTGGHQCPSAAFLGSQAIYFYGIYSKSHSFKMPYRCSLSPSRCSDLYSIQWAWWWLAYSDQVISFDNGSSRQSLCRLKHASQCQSTAVKSWDFSASPERVDSFQVNLDFILIFCSPPKASSCVYPLYWERFHTC